LRLSKLSFVIRTHNEGAFLGRLLDTLEAQEGVVAERETTVVDSGSTDETVAIAKSRGVNLIEIAKADFHYSRALNLGIDRSSGEILVILSAHSIPCTAQWLAQMISSFDDPSVAGVFSRQMPWPRAYWREVVRIREMFGAEGRRFRAENTIGDVPFSNAASCVRRDVWRRRPFTLPAAEDVDWACWAVEHGYTIVYEAGVAVYHSHDETPRQAARRLIELEKAADIRGRRSRSAWVTVRQGLGAVVRDTKEIRQFTSDTMTRAKLVLDSIHRSYWYIRDFGS
jgi:rhamnosyltransferase